MIKDIYSNKSNRFNIHFFYKKNKLIHKIYSLLNYCKLNILFYRYNNKIYIKIVNLDNYHPDYSPLLYNYFYNKNNFLSTYLKILNIII